MKVVVATQDRANVDCHFGSAPIFQFFELGLGESRLLDEVVFDSFSSEDGNHGGDAEDRLARKIEAVRGAALLFVTGIGGSVSTRVKQAGVHPVKLAEAEPISVSLARIQTMLQDNPPMWLRRIAAAHSDVEDSSQSAKEYSVG